MGIRSVINELRSRATRPAERPRTEPTSLREALNGGPVDPNFKPKVDTGRWEVLTGAAADAAAGRTLSDAQLAGYKLQQAEAVDYATAPPTDDTAVREIDDRLAAKLTF